MASDLGSVRYNKRSKLGGFIDDVLGFGVRTSDSEVILVKYSNLTQKKKHTAMMTTTITTLNSSRARHNKSNRDVPALFFRVERYFHRIRV